MNAGIGYETGLEIMRRKAWSKRGHMGRGRGTKIMAGWKGTRKWELRDGREERESEKMEFS